MLKANRPVNIGDHIPYVICVQVRASVHNHTHTPLDITHTTDTTLHIPYVICVQVGVSVHNHTHTPLDITHTTDTTLHIPYVICVQVGVSTTTPLPPPSRHNTHNTSHPLNNTHLTHHP